MNILLINYEFPPLGAGASTATWHIGKELAAMGHRVLVVTSGFKKDKGYDFKEGMTIFRCPVIRKKTSESNIFEMGSLVISAFFFLPYLIRKHRINGAIVFFSFPCGPLGVWANLVFKIPYIVSLRGGDIPGNEKQLDKLHKMLTPLRRLVYRKSLAVIANSTGAKSLAQKADPYPVKVIPNGIDTDFFSPGVNKKTDRDFQFLFSGRFSEQKNLFFMLRRLSKLKNNRFQKLTLHMAGDGPLNKQLHEFAQRSGLAKNIKWYGWVNKDKLLELYQNADCFLNPSVYEGMANAVLEAMACGLPVIASNVAGNNEVIIHGKNGFLFDPASGQEMETVIKKIIQSPELHIQMGLNARQTMVATLSWRKTAQAYLKNFLPKR